MLILWANPMNACTYAMYSEDEGVLTSKPCDRKKIVYIFTDPTGHKHPRCKTHSRSKAREAAIEMHWTIQEVADVATQEIQGA
jgi:hypothetical protein